MYDTRLKGSFKVVPLYVYKSCSIRKWTLGSISCNTTTSHPLRPIPFQLSTFGVTPGLRLVIKAIAPHWSSSYPKYLSLNQDPEEQQRVVWSRLHSHWANLASRLSKQKEQYLTLHQELNPWTTWVESSHEPLFCDTHPMLHCVIHLSAISLYKGFKCALLSTVNSVFGVWSISASGLALELRQFIFIFINNFQAWRSEESSATLGQVLILYPYTLLCLPAKYHFSLRWLCAKQAVVYPIHC